MVGGTTESSVLEWLPELVLVIDGDLRIRYVNRACRHLLAFEPEQLIGQSVLEFIHPDDRAVAVSSSMALAGKTSDTTAIEMRVMHAEGGYRRVEIVGSDTTTVPELGGMLCVARDLTSRWVWEVTSDDVAKFQQVLHHASAITLLLDRQGIVQNVNGAFTRLLGHDPTQVVEHALIGFAAPDGAPALAKAIHDAIATGERTTCEAAMRLAPNFALSAEADHRPPSRPIRFEVVNLLDDPVVAGLVVTAHDVTELQRAREALEHIATHDALTGLATRPALLERMTAIVADGSPAAVLFIDLDRFKPVNDLLGHEAGDDLLRAVSSRLERLVRPGDLVARVGGDEFVVLAPGIAEEEAGNALAARIEAALGEPYLLAAGPVRVGASVGLSLTGHGSTVAGLLADADMAMYDAKLGHRGEPAGTGARRARADERRQLADELAVGLTRGEVVAHFQPIVHATTGATIAVEALARWQHPALGLLSPTVFLDVADDAGLGLQLGDAILESACATLAKAPPDLQLCINFSVAQLSDRSLRERVAGVLSANRLTPARLRVEITEHATLPRRASAGHVSPEHNLLALRAMGASLSLDDFGTGYSSLTQVRHYPLSAIKIDRSFVAGVVDHPEDRAVVAAVVGLARMLDLQVVGEGVEHDEHLRELIELGCDAVQGYLVAPPLTAEELLDWLSSSAAADWRTAPTRRPAAR